MFRNFGLYIFSFFTLLLTACQKEPMVSNLDYKTLGSSAHDLLSSSIYTSLHVQVSYMPGYQPDTTSLNNLTSFLKTYFNKPDGIHVYLHSITSSSKTELSLSDIVAIEQKNRVEFTAGNTIAVHILITDTGFSDSTDLAISYWNTSFCLFGKSVYSKSAGGAQQARSNLISTLFQHEFGHLVGLVGQGSPQVAPHRDDSNGAHCNNPGCLMYYSVETGPSFTGIPSLDIKCINDLKANGAK
jgi:hypothetical protein